MARALARCASTLAEAGYAVELERWDAADGKGLDDLLAAGKAPEVLRAEAASQAVREILAAASAVDEPAPPDELARLQDVLDAGGAEALFRDRPLMQALAELAANDPADFAAVRASIRGRVSVRDLDQALRQYRPKPSAGASNGAGEYFEDSGCIHRSVTTRDGPVPVPLCNFTARIAEDVTHDDGAEQTCHFALEGNLADGRPLPRIVVPAGEFAAMNWVVARWGTRAVVRAGIGMKDHLRVALQLLSGDVPRRVVYGHVGWRQVEGAWVYLHGGGAIGADGLVADIPVHLPDPLSPLRLPAPPGGEELAEAVRASLGLLRLGSLRVTAPLLAAVDRAVLGEADFALHLAGPTGSYKSEGAALAQQHYGATLDARHLPASWSSTGNALEVLLFVGKDALVVVDDFCPAGSVSDVQRYHREADRLLRGQGNRSGRQRLRPDATLRPQRPPRGLTLSTGEDVPRGQSLRARVWVTEVAPGDLGPRPPAPNPQKFARDQGEGFAITANTLRKRLNEKGLLASTDQKQRGKLTVRRTLQGARRDVLHLVAGAFAPLPETGPTGPDGVNGDDAGEAPHPGAVSRNGAGVAAGPVSRAGSEQGGDGPAHGHGPKTAANGPVGRLGRSATERDGVAAGGAEEQDWTWQEGEL